MEGYYVKMLVVCATSLVLLALKSKKKQIKSCVENEQEGNAKPLSLRSHVSLLGELGFDKWAQNLSNIVDEQVAKGTLYISYPYTREAALEFKAMVEANHDMEGEYFAILYGNEQIGGMGYHLQTLPPRRHCASCGYYIAKQYRGRGLTTRALGMLIELIKQKHPQIQRLEADIFAWNSSSERVLRKCGFVCESELLRKYYVKKDGTVEDVKMMALILS